MKKILKYVLFLLIILILLFGLFLVVSTLRDYKPALVENVYTASESLDTISLGDTLTVFDWNIGFCGLGDDMSFFYDGGEKMRTTRERTIENMDGISNQLVKHNAMDFILLQEVDIRSHRSYNLNQFQKFSSILPEFYSSFSMNYKVGFIPIPVTNPMGKVESGLVSYSKFRPQKVDRHAFEGNFAWPKGLFLLDRCFMVQRFAVENGKQLLVINTHNSAYDDGSLRKKQMKMMRTFLLDEYDKGNYIMVGGDWNQNPPKSDMKGTELKEGRLIRIQIAHDFMPEDWAFLSSQNIPTNRMINEAYNPQTTSTTVIDFFLISPNLKQIYQYNLDLQFKNSDHNPTVLSFTFN